MPNYNCEVNPNTFNEQAGNPYRVTFQVRVPALPTLGCVWRSIAILATYTKPRDGFQFSGEQRWTAPGYTGLAFQFANDAEYVFGSYTWQLRAGFDILAIPFFNTLINTNRTTEKWITLYYQFHNGNFSRNGTISNLRCHLFYDTGCTPIDGGGGGGGDDDDDDDDDDPDSGSGLYRAIKADQARGWLHVGNEAAVDTKHIVPGTAAFASGSHGVKWWKMFDVDERSGMLYLLGRATGTGVSKLFRSDSGGLSVEEVLSVECNSAAMVFDDQNKWLVLLTEAEPPTPSDPNSNGVVSLRLSRDGGNTFESPVTCQYLSGSLSARLLGMTYAEREGAELFLLCQIGNQKKLLSSTDGGRKWEARIP